VAFRNTKLKPCGKHRVEIPVAVFNDRRRWLIGSARGDYRSKSEYAEAFKRGFLGDQLKDEERSRERKLVLHDLRRQTCKPRRDRA
jgi:hypothetical protein